MATYAIGDIHGCYDSLCRLLEKINYHESTDKLWFTGDLINRGPKSLKTLRFVKSLGDRAVTVIGNHDIHLLSLYYGVRKLRDKDSTLFKTLEAQDSDELIHWLQSLPVIHIHHKTIMVHAGIHPNWSLKTLHTLKDEIESKLRSVASKDNLASLYGDTEGSWKNARHSPQRLRYALNCLTRMRYCETDASPEYEYSVPPGKQPSHLTPWFEFDNKNLSGYTVIFGHWASAGYRQHNKFYALDSGCAWGNSLTALRVEDKEVFSIRCND